LAKKKPVRKIADLFVRLFITSSKENKVTISERIFNWSNFNTLYLNYKKCVMSETEKLKVALERSIKALTVKPSLGLGAGRSKTRIKNGLTCEIQEGNWKFLADMPESIGGSARVPHLGYMAGLHWEVALLSGI
jgi:hypothetical protein